MDPDLGMIGSPEMYFGSGKNGLAIVDAQDGRLGERSYTFPPSVPLNRFGRLGTWKVGEAAASSSADGDEILLRFPRAQREPGGYGAHRRKTCQSLSMACQPPVTVQRSRLYILYQGISGEHVLHLTVPKAGMSAYTFSFG
jgi:hypothetical protein